jgi:menaquinone-dependent protoporphyrinogen oxidase
MNVLIAVASRHGSTTEIGERIAETLRHNGCSVDVVEAEATRWLDDEHDAYVVGSAVYLDRWTRDARRFVAANERVLTRHPVWFFSSGPLGPSDEDGTVTSTIRTGASTAIAPIEHRVFPGRLDRDDLSSGERVVASLVHAPTGDFRDWTAIDAWAEQIGHELTNRAGSDRQPDPTRAERR